MLARFLYWLRNLPALLRFVLLGGSTHAHQGKIEIETKLSLRVFRRDPSVELPTGYDLWPELERNAWSLAHAGSVQELGTVSRRVVTDAGCNYIRDSFAAHAGSADVQLMKFHDSGTGTTAEATTDTDLVTPAGPTTRATGTQANGTAKRYDTVGTITYAGTLAITEWGLFNQAARGAGTVLFDRFKFAAVNVASGDSIQGTIQITFPSGG
jgi:hypothetical protein